jgi:serine/threonine protein kinase
LSFSDSATTKSFSGENGFVAVKLSERSLSSFGSLPETMKPSEGTFDSHDTTAQTDPIEILQSVRHEIYLMHAIHHPAIVTLLGVCVDFEFPSLVLEYLPGGDLFGQLHDPICAENRLIEFNERYNQEYLKASSDVPLMAILGGEISEMERFLRANGCSDSMKNAFHRYVHLASRHWIIRTASSHSEFQQSFETLQIQYRDDVHSLSPLTWTARLRIATDVLIHIYFLSLRRFISFLQFTFSFFFF